MKKKIQSFSTPAFSIFEFSNFQIFKFGVAGLLYLLLSFPALGQDSSHLRVSLITCGPGGPNDELYTTFGHSGIRIVDSSSVTDYVYNYGNFDAFEDNFYINFIKGRLRYYVNALDFKDFVEEYKASNRSVTEQVLALNPAEKIDVQKFLNNNIQKANRHYMYDFCLDNCTTRVRDIIKKNHDSTFTQMPVLPMGTTFRQAIHFCLDRNDQYWSKLGIDLLLGKPCDAVMTTEQMDFLPENLMHGIEKAKQPFVQSVNKIFIPATINYRKAIFTPLVVFSILLFLIMAISFSRNKKAVIFLNGFDGLLFFLTGALGILFVFMWTDTDHSMVKNNFNLIWAWPTNAIMAFFVNSKKQWVKKYFTILIAGLIIVLLSWFFLPQLMNNALLPIVLLLLYRSFRRYQAF